MGELYAIDAAVASAHSRRGFPYADPGWL